MKDHILWVTQKEAEGYSSMWYGWSRELKFTYTEALKAKENLLNKYYDVEIIKV